MTRCSSHSWIQIVLNLVEAVPIHITDLPGPLLLESPVSCGANEDEGMRDATFLFASLGFWNVI